MDTYTFLREVAGSWMLLFMFTFFVVVVVWVITGRSKSYTDTAEIIFRHEDKPLDDVPAQDASQDDIKEARS